MGHRHPAFIGGRAAAAAASPPQLCRAILRGAEARHRANEGLPPSVQAELAICGLGGLAVGPAAAGVARPEEVSAAVVDEGVHGEDERTRVYAEAGQVFGGYTGAVLPAELVAKAREEGGHAGVKGCWTSSPGRRPGKSPAIAP